MAVPKIINKDGEAPTAEEIAAANRVASTFKAATVGTFKITDLIDDITVEYHAYDNTAYTEGGNSIYFGYDASVEMRCPRRGISLIETALDSANPRSAVFITDGTELTSVPLSYEYTEDPHRLSLFKNTFAGFHPDFGLDGWWLGGSKIAYYNGVYTYPNSPPAQLSVNVDAQHQGYMTINIPDDVAFNQPDPRYSTAYPSTYYYSNEPGFNYCRVMVSPRTTNSNTEQNTKTMRLEMQLQFGNGFYHPHQVLGEYVIPLNVDPYVSIEYKNAWAAVANIMNNQDYVRHGNYVVESATELLNRNIRYNKKCSDSKIAMLRNGILPAEFEWGIFAKHPLSYLLRRSMPMEIEHNSVDLISSDVQSLADGATVTTKVYQGTVTLKYFNTITNTEIRETFTGKATVVKTTHVSPLALNLTSIQVNYENFPFLYDSTGRALNTNGRLNDPEYLDVFYYDTYKFTPGRIHHDDNFSPLFLICNGSFIKTNHVKDDGLDVYLDFGQDDPYFQSELLLDYNPPYPQSSRNLQYTHPQFVYDYIAASKPIEKELDAEGNKVPVTPSTDWLSSRLADKEIVTIVPLSFVSTGGVEVGMFPIKENGAPVYDGNYDFNYQIGEKAKIYGFARFQFDYAANTFAFKDWTEFTTEGKVKHDGNATYDDATNPTQLTMGDKTYTIEPKVIDCDPAWINTNCVFIGNKLPWTDVKDDAKEQKAHIADTPPEGYVLTDEERLYHEVRKAIK